MQTIRQGPHKQAHNRVEENKDKTSQSAKLGVGQIQIGNNLRSKASDQSAVDHIENIENCEEQQKTHCFW